MTHTAFDAKIRFKIKGQSALAKWQQEAIKRGLDSPTGPPEALRFNCRIAQDAKENFADIPLADGSSLRLDPRGVQPQFGKNRHGEAYLTATLVHSGSGDSFKVQWIGDAVPDAMKTTAVMHDEGRKVGAKTVLLDLAKARVTPVHEVAGNKDKAKRDIRAEEKRRAELRAAGVPKRTRSRRQCSRLTSADLAS